MGIDLVEVERGLVGLRHTGQGDARPDGCGVAVAAGDGKADVGNAGPGMKPAGMEGVFVRLLGRRSAGCGEIGGRHLHGSGGGCNGKAFFAALDGCDLGLADIDLLALLAFLREDDGFVDLDGGNGIEGDDNIAGIIGVDGKFPACK